MDSLWIRDGRNYRKLVNDGVLRKFECVFCKKQLKPATFSVRDTPLNHQLKYVDLIPVQSTKISDVCLLQSYYLGLPLGFSVASVGPWSTNLDNFKKLICSKKCTGLVALEDQSKSSVLKIHHETFADFKNSWIGVDISYNLQKLTTPTGAALQLLSASSNVSIDDFVNQIKTNLRSRHGFRRIQWVDEAIIATSDGAVTQFLDFCQKTVYPDITFSDSYNAQRV